MEISSSGVGQMHQTFEYTLTELESTLTQLNFLGPTASITELESYRGITRKNIEAFAKIAKDRVESLKKTKMGNVAKQKISIAEKQMEGQRKKLELEVVGMWTEGKANGLARLQAQLCEAKEKLESLRQKKAEEEQHRRIGTKHLKHAAKFYTKHFQYDIKVKHEDGTKNYSALVTFHFGKRVSKHPVRFLFKRGTNKIFGFDAGSLLTKEEKNMVAREDYVSNPPMLFCLLREIAEKKLE